MSSVFSYYFNEATREQRLKVQRAADAQRELDRLGWSKPADPNKAKKGFAKQFNAPPTPPPDPTAAGRASLNTPRQSVNLSAKTDVGFWCIPHSGVYLKLPIKNFYTINDSVEEQTGKRPAWALVANARFLSQHFPWILEVLKNTLTNYGSNVFSKSDSKSIVAQRLAVDKLQTAALDNGWAAVVRSGNTIDILEKGHLSYTSELYHELKGTLEQNPKKVRLGVRLNDDSKITVNGAPSTLKVWHDSNTPTDSSVEKVPAPPKSAPPSPAAPVPKKTPAAPAPAKPTATTKTPPAPAPAPVVDPDFDARGMPMNRDAVKALVALGAGEEQAKKAVMAAKGLTLDDVIKNANLIVHGGGKSTPTKAAPAKPAVSSTPPPAKPLTGVPFVPTIAEDIKKLLQAVATGTAFPGASRVLTYVKSLNNPAPEVQIKRTEIMSQLSPEERAQLRDIMAQLMTDSADSGIDTILEMTFRQLYQSTVTNGLYKSGGGLKKVNSPQGVRWVIDASVPGRIANSKFVVTRPPNPSIGEDGLMTVRFNFKSRPDRSTTNMRAVGFVKFLAQGRRGRPSVEIDRDCHVFCTCPDFKYRWHKVLSDKDAAHVPTGIGGEATNEAPVVTNPGNKIAICKHLCAMHDYLGQKSADYAADITTGKTRVSKTGKSIIPVGDNKDPIVKSGAKLRVKKG